MYLASFRAGFHLYDFRVNQACGLKLELFVEKATKPGPSAVWSIGRVRLEKLAAEKGNLR